MISNRVISSGAGGDCHIYDNHLEQTALQLSREPRPYPKLVIKRRPASLFEYEYEDFEFEGYDPWAGHQGAGSCLNPINP